MSIGVVARGRVGARAGRQGAGLHAAPRGRSERRQRERVQRAAGGSAPPATTPSTSTATRRRSTPRTSRATARSSFVNSAGDVLDAAQETDLQSYVKGGGGFVGIGETAKLEEGNAFFDTLIGLTGAPRTTAASAASTQDVEFLDRVHPATRDLAALVQGALRQLLPVDQQPDGPGPHRRARALQHASRTARRSPTTRSRASTGTSNTLQPQQRARRCPGAATSSRAARSTPAWARPPPRTTTTPQEAPPRRHPVGRRHGPRQLQGDDQLELHRRRA